MALGGSVLGVELMPSIVFGAALTATSIGIYARVLSDLGRLRTPEGQVVIGANIEGRDLGRKRGEAAMTQDQADRLARIVVDFTALALDLGAIVATPTFRPELKQTPLQALIGRAAFDSGVSVRTLIGKERTSEVSHVRQAIMAKAYNAGHTLASIGRAMGNRDHTTIMYGIAAHDLRMATWKAAGQ